MGLLHSIFGINSTAKKVTELLQKGAIIIDVRTAEEFSKGKIPNSKNVPLQEFERSLDEIIKIGSPIILCCQSGMRSKKAFSILKKKRTDCMNAGSWQNIKGLVQK